VEKRIPAGAGLGGGSSDAATTLLGLNRLWQLTWPRARLAALALQLGADVPFFIGGHNAFVEGIGEQLTRITLPAAWYAVIWPGVPVSTATVFSDPGLTRATKITTIADFSSITARTEPTTLFGRNDLEAVVKRQVPAVAAALAHLNRFGPARMSGSGSAVFAPFGTALQAQAALENLPQGWHSWVCCGLAEHPLAAW
jgi:4-diphosphocytidyl-2-C-methyl-D-erythritol kinase